MRRNSATVSNSSEADTASIRSKPPDSVATTRLFSGGVSV